MYYIYNNCLFIKIYGREAKNFIQNIFTNDIDLINKNNKFQFSALCNNLGRIMSIVLIKFISKEEYILVFPINISNVFINTINKYATFSEVKITIVDNYQLILVIDNIKNKLTINNFFFLNINNKELNSKSFNINNKKYSKIKYNDVRYYLLINKFPYIDIKNTEKFLPSELELDSFDIVSYNKGCFIGQEIIARIKYLVKKIKYKLVIIYTEDLNYNKNESITIVNKITINQYVYLLILLKINDVIPKKYHIFIP